MATPTANEFRKLKEAAPSWVYNLMYPADKAVLESLSIDALFEWMGNLTRGNPRDVWDMYFMVGDELKQEYSEWIANMYTKKQVGAFWRRIRAIPKRWKRALPLWGE
jgi:hypothetical protein